VYVLQETTRILSHWWPCRYLHIHCGFIHSMVHSLIVLSVLLYIEQSVIVVHMIQDNTMLNHTSLSHMIAYCNTVWQYHGLKVMFQLKVMYEMTCKTHGCVIVIGVHVGGGWLICLGQPRRAHRCYDVAGFRVINEGRHMWSLIAGWHWKSVAVWHAFRCCALSGCPLSLESSISTCFMKG